MPFDNTGTFTRIHSWEQDRIDGVSIDSSRMDADTDDIANGLSQCMLRTGEGAMQSNLNMGNYKILNVGNGTSATDAVNKGQLDTAVASVSGNVTALDAAVVKLTGDQTIAGVKTFSSSPVLPTPASSDNSTNGATTAFVKSVLSSNGGMASWSQNANGYYKFSNGLIVQWGYASNSPVTFPTAFSSSSSYNIGAQLAGSGAGANDYGQLNSLSATGFSWVMYSSSSRLHWVAIGY